MIPLPLTPKGKVIRRPLAVRTGEEPWSISPEEPMFSDLRKFRGLSASMPQPFSWFFRGISPGKYGLVLG
jgi:hypothetical protein